MAHAKSETREGGSLAVLAMAAWAAVLIAAFLWYRGNDIGRLPSLFSNLGGGSLFGDGLSASIAGFVLSALIVQSWLGLGRFVCSFIPPLTDGCRSLFLQIPMNAAVGAAIWSLIFFFLGLAGAYTGVVAFVAVAVGTILLFVPRQGSPTGIGLDWKNLSRIEWALVALIAVPVVLAVIAALAPPVAKDTLLYHYALPKAYIARHGIPFIEGNIASYLPLGAEMHFVWAMLLGGSISQRAAEAAAGGVSVWFFLLLIIAVYGWVRELTLDRRSALVAALTVASVPTAYYVAASGYIDNALALFVTLSVYALSRWWGSEANGWLVLVAIFLGSALSIKLTSIFIFAAFALVMLLRARKAKNESRLLAMSLGALIVAGIFAAPWYLRTWKETGSPVFPFYMSMWKGQAPGWDTERSNLFQAMNSQYGGVDKSAIDYLILPWNVSVTAQPDVQRYFDGVIGVGFLLGLPVLIWTLWKMDPPIDVKIGAAIAGIMFLLWLSSSQQLRYLLPVLPILAIAIVVAVDELSTKVEKLRPVMNVSLAASGVVGILTITAWFCQAAPLRVVLGGESRDQYLTRNIDYYPYYVWLNSETTPDSKVWLINMRRDTYDLDRPVFSDYLFEDWTLRKMIWESNNAAELREKASSMGIRYVLTRHDFLFDYDRSTIVDDKKTRTENEAKLKIAREFILDPARTIKADEKFSLVKVF
jgi:hypothetical protein